MWKRFKKRVADSAWYNRNRQLLKIIYAAFSIVVWVATFTGLGKYIEDFQVIWIDPTYRGYIYQAIGAAVVGITGVGLFLVRLRYRVQYGFLEIGFALATAFFTIGRLMNPSNRPYEGPLNLLAVGASVYLVVRGIDNVYQAIDEKAKLWAEAEAKRIMALPENQSLK